MRFIQLYILTFIFITFSFSAAQRSSDNSSTVNPSNGNNQSVVTDNSPMLYQLLGEWDAYQVRKNRDGSWSTDTTYSQWDWYSILDGDAIQDDWITVTGDAKSGISQNIEGRNIRIYNPEEKQWHMVWVGLALRRMASFTAVEENEKVIMSGRNINGREVRNTFFNISKNSFDWKQEWTFDEGKSWVVVNKIHCVRR